MPLKLSLKPGERFVLNGAVVVNGDRRASLVLQNKASILREKDILQEEDVTTPARRIYFPIMMMYLDPENSAAYYKEFAVRTTEFMGAVATTEVLETCISISHDVMAGQYYKALMKCRKLLAFEEEKLAHVASGLPEGATGHRDSA
ncbi:MAG: flagellar biosynthesis repressor FlbT [Alphaproteobacteria bacterium]